MFIFHTFWYYLLGSVAFLLSIVHVPSSGVTLNGLETLNENSQKIKQFRFLTVMCSYEIVLILESVFYAKPRTSRVANQVARILRDGEEVFVLCWSVTCVSCECEWESPVCLVIDRCGWWWGWGGWWHWCWGRFWWDHCSRQELRTRRWRAQRTRHWRTVARQRHVAVSLLCTKLSPASRDCFCHLFLI